VKHFTTSDFWKCYEKLPENIQDLADKNYELLKQDARYPSLHFKKVNSYWSVRVGIDYRAVGVEIEEGILWFWIGIHTEYDKLIG
jgi:hypothetical protein